MYTWNGQWFGTGKATSNYSKKKREKDHHTIDLIQKLANKLISDPASYVYRPCTAPTRNQGDLGDVPSFGFWGATVAV